MSNFRKLEYTDYYKDYLKLLSQLTECNQENVSYFDFCRKLDRIEESNIHIYVCEKDKKIIATATLVLEHKFIHDLSIVGHVEDVVVDKNHRGNDLGKNIILHLVQLAKENGCYKIILDCNTDNIGFYIKCGFQIKGLEMAMYF